MTLLLLARSTIFRTIPFRHNKTTSKSIQTSDQKTQNQRSSIPFYNWLKKTVTPPTQAFHHWAPNITSPVPRIKSLVPAMTVPTIAKACAAGGALAGTAVVLSLNAKTGLILAPLAGVVVLTYVLQDMVSNTFKMGKNAASIAPSLTTVTSGLARTATVLNTIAPPLAVALQTTGQLQELSVVNGDTKKQKSALHRQRISAGLWSILGCSIKRCWDLL